MNQLHFIIPQLISKEYLPRPRSELARLLCYGKKIARQQNLEHCLIGLFTQADPQTIGIAQLTALADKLPRSPHRWLRADPIELKADLAAVYVLGNDHLALKNSELTELATGLTTLLAPLGLKLYVPHPQRWYLQYPASVNINTYPLAAVQGKDMLAYMPKGEDFFWQRLLTEIQMYLHQSPVNLVRLQQGKPVVNGLWLWGEGPKPPLAATGLAGVFSQCPLAIGLAAHYQVPGLDFVPNYAAFQAAIHPEKGLKTGEYVVYDTQLQSLFQQGNVSAYADYIMHLDQHWLSPLYRALKNRSLEKLSVYPGDGFVYEVTPWRLWQFWKRRAKLSYTQ